jgi:hypothetical protein
MNLVARIKAPTPKFWKRAGIIASGIAAIGLTIGSAGILSPVLGTWFTIVGIGAGGFATASTLTVDKDKMKTFQQWLTDFRRIVEENPELKNIDAFPRLFELYEKGKSVEAAVKLIIKEFEKHNQYRPESD